MQRSRAGFSDFVPDCMIIHLFLVGWVMYFFVRFLCRFYLTNTDKDMLEFEEPIGEVLGAILYGFDIRKQEHIVNRAAMAHKLLFQDKKDYSFMCMELLLTVMICVHEDKSCIVNSSIDGSTPEDMFKNRLTNQSEMPGLSRYFSEEAGKIIHGYSFAGEPSLFISLKIAYLV